MPKQQIRLLATSLTTGKNDSSTTDMTNQTPKGLPPKSPSSATVRIVQSTISAVPRRRSKGRGNRRGKRSANAKSIFSDENSESSSHSCERGKSRSTEQSLDQQVYQPVELIPNRSLLDPGPNHMNVTGNADDFFSTPDLNMVSFESTSSPTSVVEPLSTHDEKTFSRRHMNHHRTKSWDLYDDFNYNASNAKACLPSIFRRQKVMSADVASVGNASDTLVMVGESGGRISGRDLHEKAKEVLNAGDYSRAVMMFEALQKAQIDRFGKWHSSVGAATHNVAVVRLRMGQAESAEDLFEEAVAIRRKVLGNDHLDLAVSTCFCMEYLCEENAHNISLNRPR